MIRYSQSNNTVEAYVNGAWADVATGASTGIVLGSSSSATNPQRSGDVTTGFFSPATGTVAVSNAGTEMMRVNGTGVGIGSTSPAVSLDLSPKTDAISLPSGTSAQRPSGVNGMLRYNSTTHGVEAYQGATAAWGSLAAASGRYALTDGATIAVDWNNGNIQYVTIAGNRTFTFANGVDGGRYILVITQDGTGSRTVTWPASVRWGGGTAPTLTTTASKTDYVGFIYNGGASKYDGVSMAQNF